MGSLPSIAEPRTTTSVNVAVERARTSMARLAPARTAARRLIDEHEMGELFKVVALAKGVVFDAVGFAQGDRSHRL